MKTGARLFALMASLEGLPCCGGYLHIYAGNPPQTIRQHVRTCSVIPSDLRRYEPKPLKCGNCGDTVDPVFEEDNNGVEWVFDCEQWRTPKHDYLCSRSCYLVSESWFWSGEGKWERNG